MSEVESTGTTPERTSGAGPGASEEPRAPEGEITSWARRALIASAVVALGVWVSLPTLAIIGALIFMIFMHELGHYITAKAAGMKVTEFFLGFGPRLWSFRRGETEYGIKAIPAGAYVRIIGMSNLEEVDPADEARAYRQKPYWRRMSVAVAGSTMHFLMAIALFFTVINVVGQSVTTSEAWTVGRSRPRAQPPPLGFSPVIASSPSTVDGSRTSRHCRPSSSNDRVTTSSSWWIVPVGRSRWTPPSGPPAPRVSRSGSSACGPEFPAERVNPLTGVVESVQATGETMWLSVGALGAFFSPDGLSGYVATLTGNAPPRAGEAPEDRVVSVVGAVQLASQSPDLAAALYFLFAINIFLGVFNLVPLLPFDGGHVAIATYERIRSRKGRRHFADVSKLMPVTYAVVALLAFVFVTSIYLDIVDPVAPSEGARGAAGHPLGRAGPPVPAGDRGEGHRSACSR